MKNKILSFWRKNDFISSVVVLVAYFTIFMVFYSYASSVVIDDHLFHYKLAKLIRTEGFRAITDFQWIQLSEQAQEHERYSITLYNFALIPFTFFNNDITGVKVVDMFWASSFLAAIYYSLRKFKVKYAFLLTLLIVSSKFFTARIMLGRGFVFALALMISEVYFFGKGKYKQGFLISLLHIFWHPSTYLIPLLIAIIVEISRHLQCRKAKFETILAASGAIVLGMMINPRFPKVLWELINALAIIVHGAGTNLGMIEGAELLPQTAFKIGYDYWQFTLALFVGSAVAVHYFISNKRKEMEQEQEENAYDEHLHFVYAFFLLSFSMFGLAIMASARFIDIFAVFAVILFAVSMRKLVEDKKLSLDKGMTSYAMAGIFLFLVLPYATVLLYLRDEKMYSHTQMDPSAVGKASQWLKERSLKGETIFLAEWGDFSAAFLYNDHNYYTMGLEPRATHAYNEKLFWKWYNININNYYCEKMEDCKEELNSKMLAIRDNPEKFKDFRDENAQKIIASIKNDFNSRLVLSTKRSLNDLLATQKDLIEDSYQAYAKESGQRAHAFILK